MADTRIREQLAEHLPGILVIAAAAWGIPPERVSGMAGYIIDRTNLAAVLGDLGSPALVATPEKLAQVIDSDYQAADPMGEGYKPAPITLARAIIASGVVEDRREVQAAALEAAADQMPAFHDGDQPEWAITAACRWLRDRAAEVRR